MSENDGEKELILGNKQLVSLFFVVVALCGVFFAMGYMVRGNSLKATLSNLDETASAQTSQPGATLKRQQPEPPRETADSTPSDPAPQTAMPQTTAPAIENPSAPPPAAYTETKPAAPAPAAAPTGDAEGTYVQVAALGLADAEATVRTLREQHLPASVVPSPKEGLYRVRVGPYHQTSEVADAKALLKTLGFSNTIGQKQ